MNRLSSLKNVDGTVLVNCFLNILKIFYILIYLIKATCTTFKIWQVDTESSFVTRLQFKICKLRIWFHWPN